MEGVRRFLREGGESDYLSAVRLTEVESKSDPVTDPYRSFYLARELWAGLRARIEEGLRDCCPREQNGIQGGENGTQPGTEGCVEGESDPYGSEDAALVWRLLGGAMDMRLGSNYADTEEKTVGLEHLERCVGTLMGLDTDPRVISLYQAALNQLGMLISELRGPVGALVPLLRAEALHARAERELRGSSPWTPDELFSPSSYKSCHAKQEMAQKEGHGGIEGGTEKDAQREAGEEVKEEAVKETQGETEGVLQGQAEGEPQGQAGSRAQGQTEGESQGHTEGGQTEGEVEQRRREAFEDVHTHTLYFLAQVYEKLGNSALSARYCHATLRRQLSARSYDALDWALNAATLAQYYLSTNDFELSRHCLVSAELVLAETGPRPDSLYVSYESGEEGTDDDSATVSLRERTPKAWADLARCWLKYSLALLDYSRERLFANIEGAGNDRGMEDGGNSRGVEAGVNNGGIDGGVNNDGIDGGVNNGRIDGGVNNGGIEVGVNNIGMNNGVDNGRIEGEVNDGGIKGSCEAPEKRSNGGSVNVVCKNSTGADVVSSVQKAVDNVSNTSGNNFLDDDAGRASSITMEESRVSTAVVCGVQGKDTESNGRHVGDQKLDVGGQGDVEQGLGGEGEGRRGLFFPLSRLGGGQEARMACMPISSYADARSLFLLAQEWVRGAQDFYRLDGHCSDHVALLRDHSALYRLLAFFDADLERQCKMHKRRADLIAGVLKQLNIQHYLLVCRQLMFELGEIYSTMLDNKLALTELHAPSAPLPMKEALSRRSKINTLTRQSIAHFQSYVDTLRDPRGKLLPPRFSDEDERPALAAHFHLGRLHSKLLDPDPRGQLEGVRASLEKYRYIVEYCRSNPMARGKMAAEVEICEEMVVLLPAKMEKLRTRISI